MTVNEHATLEAWVSQRWEKRVGPYIRFYEARLQPDLWGDWTIVLIWGRRSSARGRVVFVPVADYAAGMQLIERTDRRRRQRGYETVRCKQ